MAKTGRKPIGETAKIAYSTKLPEDQVMFLRSLPNAAAWLSAAILLVRVSGPELAAAKFGRQNVEAADGVYRQIIEEFGPDVVDYVMGRDR